MLTHSGMRPAQGVTLVELLVTVAIIAILLAMGAPSFQTFIQNTQIRTAAEGMLAGLNLARTEALRRNTRVSLWLVTDVSMNCARSNTGTSWVVSLDDPANDCNEASSLTTAPRIVQVRSASEGGTGVNVGATSRAGAASSCITFNGFGTVDGECAGGGSPIARIAFVSAAAPDSTRDLRIQISAGGAARLCDPDATSGPSVCEEDA